MKRMLSVSNLKIAELSAIIRKLGGHNALLSERSELVGGLRPLNPVGLYAWRGELGIHFKNSHGKEE